MPPAPADLAALLASLAAIGRSLHGPFDPRSFLGEFSASFQPLVPHDRVAIACVEDEGRTVTIFAEYGPQGPPLHEGRYTIAFDPAGRYTPDELGLAPVLAGAPLLVAGGETESGRTVDRLAQRAGVRSRLAVPLTSGDRIVGALLAGSRAPGAYREVHLAAARQVGDLIGPLVDSVVGLHREQRRRRRLGALAGLARVFATSLSVADVFDGLGEAIRPILDFDTMGVSLISESGRDLAILVRTDRELAPEGPQQVSLDDLSFSPALLRGEAVLVRDAPAELDAGRPGDRAILERGLRACLCVPLPMGEQVGGALYFGKRRPYWFDGADVEVASGIAAGVVVAVQHQRLAEEQRRVAAVEARARRLERRVASLRETLREQFGFERIVGRAPALRDALTRAARVAPTETTVLVTGESGTGKELVARAIHAASPRADGPFLAINCAALPETLIESELFGHEKGAFTGADRQKPGRFELAAGGTLFLDEIGELSASAQAKLLRFLESHELERVGGTATLHADVRLVVATHRDLERAVAEGRFREDLYYRLAVFQVHLPPLRERGDDVLLLAGHFVRTLGARMGKGEPGLARDARDLLLTHRWPGNIRELANAIERALIVSDGGLLTAAQLGVITRPGTEAGQSDARSGPEPLVTLERRAITEALRRARGNKTRAAAALGLTRTQLYTRLRRFGVEPRIPD